VTGGVGDDGSIGDLPWASVFDPVANARALSAIQARGFSAATHLVDRFIKIAESSTNGTADKGVADTKNAADKDVDLVLSTWWSLLGQFLRTMPGANAPRGDGPQLDLAHETGSGGVHLDADEPGFAIGEVWLHNSGTNDIASVRLRCSDLLAHDGAEVSRCAVQFSPDRLPLPGRSSRAVSLRIDVTPDIAPGRYRGTLLAEGYPELWLPVTLTVRAPAE
jgi:hypothetical protein